MDKPLKRYFDTVGPCNLPMKDKQAKSLECRLKNLPKEDAYAFRRLSITRGMTELLSEGRCDVSWITEQTPDRTGDVVLAAGMDDSHFQLNPIVTLNHCYTLPPVGRSLWRRRVREGSLIGVKAKTLYPPRPDSWPGTDWPPDYAFELVRAGLLAGKSIGFFPLKVRTPSAEEIAAQPEMSKVRFVIEEWLLAEYACCVLPMQPHAVVEEVTKALPEEAARALGIERARGTAPHPQPLSPLRGRGEQAASPLSPLGQGQQTSPLSPLGRAPGGEGPTRPLAFTPLTEIERSLTRRLACDDFERILQKSLQRSLAKARGHV